MPLIAGLAVLWFMVIAWATRDTREAAHDGRSIDRYSNAMRVLSRRPPAKAPGAGPGRVIVVPPATITDPARRRMTAVERRRRNLRHLVIASGVSFAGLLLGGPWLWIHLTIDLALVAYVVFLRKAALKTAAEARAQRLAELRRREAEHRAAYEAAHAAPDATVLTMPEREERRKAVGH